MTLSRDLARTSACKASTRSTRALAAPLSSVEITFRRFQILTAPKKKSESERGISTVTQLRIRTGISDPSSRYEEYTSASSYLRLACLHRGHLFVDASCHSSYL